MQLQQEQEQSIFPRIDRAEAGAAIVVLLFVAVLVLLAVLFSG